MNSIPTRVNFSKRGVELPALLCLMCQVVNESSQHLFVQCDVAHYVWDR